MQTANKNVGYSRGKLGIKILTMCLSFACLVQKEPSSTVITITIKSFGEKEMEINFEHGHGRSEGWLKRVDKWNGASEREDAFTLILSVYTER